MSVALRSSGRAYVELLATLLLTWGVLFGISRAGPRLVALGVPVATVDFDRYLAAPNAASAPARPLAGLAPAAAESEPMRTPKVEDASASETRPASLVVPRRPVERAPQRILVFGDSTVKSLMWRLSDYCAQSGHTMFAASWYGSTTIGWGVKERLDLLLAQQKPTFVIVSLGSSELTLKDVEGRETFIKSIIGKIGERPFVWVGPPNMDPDTGINALIERVVGRERFFRSAGLELARFEDNFHPSEEGGKVWMDAIAGWIVTSSATPIVLDTPTRPGPPPDRQIFSQER